MLVITIVLWIVHWIFLMALGWVMWPLIKALPSWTAYVVFAGLGSMCLFLFVKEQLRRRAQKRGQIILPALQPIFGAPGIAEHQGASKRIEAGSYVRWH